MGEFLVTIDGNFQFVGADVGGIQFVALESGQFEALTTQVGVDGEIGSTTEQRLPMLISLGEVVRTTGGLRVAKFGGLGIVMLCGFDGGGSAIDQLKVIGGGE